MSKYAPLQTFLAGAGETDLELSFDDIERTLGFRLPRSARFHRPWWSNEGRGMHVHARAWMDAGYSVRELDLARRRVRFRRNSANLDRPAITAISASSDPPIRDPISAKRPALSPKARELLANYSVDASHDDAVALGRALHEEAKAWRTGRT